jgi:hypothetical protein
MFRLLQARGRRHTKKDYTKESSVTWFVVLLVLLAAYLIIRTLTANHGEPKGDDLRGKKISMGQTQPLSLVQAAPRSAKAFSS